MWDISNLDLGFKLPFGKRYFEKEPTRSAPSRVEIIKKIFGKLSDLYQEISLKFGVGQKFRIEIRDDENTAVINSKDIAAIETRAREQNILEIRLKLGNNEQIVTITDPRKVSIVYVKAKPAEPRLDANAGEVQYDSDSETVGYRLQQIFGANNDLKGLNVRELKPQEALDLQRNLNSYSALIIVENNSVPTDLKTLEEFLNIKIVDQYQGINLSNVLVLPMGAIQQITAAGRLNFISVTWKEGKSSRLKDMVFPWSNYRFFVVMRPEAESTNVAKPGSPRGPLAESSMPRRRTLRDVLLKINSLNNLDDREITTLSLTQESELLEFLDKLNVDLQKRDGYYLVIGEKTLFEGLSGSSILNLELPPLSTELKFSVVAISSIKKFRTEFLQNGTFFGIDISWYDPAAKTALSMVYPIRNYHFYLIEIPKISGMNTSFKNI